MCRVGVESVTKGQVTGTAQVDTPFTYWVAITLAGGGTEDIGNARILDTLPPGAQFLSASQGGTYDAGTNTVSWQIGTIVPSPNNPVTVAPEVTVVFPSSTFQAGDQPVNTGEAFGAPAGGPDQSLGRATFPVTLRAAGAITSASKRSGLGSLGPGQSDTYTLTGGNPNAGPLDSFTLLENLPVALSMVQDGSPNLTGSGTAPQVAWRPLGGGAFQAIGAPPAGGGWGAAIPAAADEMQLSYGHRAHQLRGLGHRPGRHRGQWRGPRRRPRHSRLDDPELRHGQRVLGRHAGDPGAPAPTRPWSPLPPPCCSPRPAPRPPRCCPVVA